MPDVHSIDAVTEKEFQSVVIDAARLFHWSVWHVPDSRMQAGGKLVGSALAAGLPDLILVHRAFGFVFAELKRQKGKIRPTIREKMMRSKRVDESSVERATRRRPVASSRCVYPSTILYTLTVLFYIFLHA